jgi:G patch domain and KOW motifs-containing protein
LDVLILGGDELESRPYSMAAYQIYKAKVDAERESNEAVALAAESSADKSDKRLRESGDDNTRSSKKSKDEDKDGGRDKDKHKGSSKGKDRDRDRDRDREESWLRNGIRVKLITKKFGDKFYLMKSSILDVYGLGLASVRLDDGKVIENVKQKYLETVLPAVGGTCVILRGKRLGQQAILLERKKELEQVVVQMQDDLDVYILSADDIAATS